MLAEQDFYPMGVMKKYGSYSRNPGPNPVQLSIRNPCYGFVRENLKDALYFKYSELFKRIYRCEYTAIVHVNSATYKKAFELHNPQAQESEYKTIF